MLSWGKGPDLLLLGDADAPTITRLAVEQKPVLRHVQMIFAAASLGQTERDMLLKSAPQALQIYGGESVYGTWIWRHDHFVKARAPSPAYWQPKEE
jgi:competence protein ComEC